MRKGRLAKPRSLLYPVYITHNLLEYVGIAFYLSTSAMAKSAESGGPDVIDRSIRIYQDQSVRLFVCFT